MTRIHNAFEGKKAFVGFVTAGDPSLDKTEEFVLQMEKAGAGLVELGIPFSDPIAEGTVIQEANIRALKAGCTTDKLFDMVARLRQKTQIPLVFLAYLNTLFKYGYEKFCSKCEGVGIDGVIIPDMPFEEKGELADIAAAHNVDIISMIAPASEDRIRMIAKETTGFIYVVSSVDVAEVSGGIITDAGRIAGLVKEVTDTPTAVDLDINTVEQMYKHSPTADGVIVGSDIVKIVARYGDDAGSHIYDYVHEMVERLAG